MKKSLIIGGVIGLIIGIFLTSLYFTNFNNQEVMDKEKIALDYCNANGDLCDLGFTKVSTEIKNLGFNCAISKDAEVYLLNDYGGIPERGYKWYLVSDKVEAVFETIWEKDPINTCLN